MTRGVAPNCKRIHFDVPQDLADLIEADAAKPPAVKVAEWCRRLAAWKVGYDLPPERDRKVQRVRLTGEPKLRTGPKRKYLLEDGEGVPCG